MVILLLPIAVVVVEPLPYTPLLGKLVPEAVISQKEIVLLSFPLGVEPSVEKKILPPLVPTAIVDAPLMVQRVSKLLVAPLIYLIVDVPDVAETVVFSIVKLFPPLFNPSIVTLSAPFKSNSGEPAAIAPAIVLSPPLGEMVIDV